MPEPRINMHIAPINDMSVWNPPKRKMILESFVCVAQTTSIAFIVECHHRCLYFQSLSLITLIRVSTYICVRLLKLTKDMDVVSQISVLSFFYYTLDNHTSFSSVCNLLLDTKKIKKLHFRDSYISVKLQDIQHFRPTIGKREETTHVFSKI